MPPNPKMSISSHVLRPNNSRQPRNLDPPTPLQEVMQSDDQGEDPRPCAVSSLLHTSWMHRGLRFCASQQKVRASGRSHLKQTSKKRRGDGQNCEMAFCRRLVGTFALVGRFASQHFPVDLHRDVSYTNATSRDHTLHAEGSRPRGGVTAHTPNRVSRSIDPIAPIYRTSVALFIRRFVRA